MSQTALDSFILLHGHIRIDLELSGRHIAAEDSEVRPVGIVVLILNCMMDVMEQGINFFTKANWVQPQKYMRPSLLAKTESPMTAVAVIPDCIDKSARKMTDRQ